MHRQVCVSCVHQLIFSRRALFYCLIDSGIISTLYTGLAYVYCIWGDSVGTLYASSFNGNLVYSMSQQQQGGGGGGSMVVFAGGGSSQSDGAAATAAYLNYPMGLWGDTLGMRCCVSYKY